MIKTINNLALLILLTMSGALSAQAPRFTYQAANSCQPRLYTQLDFFKISSGALKNNSSSAKSIICSANTENFLDEELSYGVRVWLGYQTDASMPCTLYMRERGSGALVDSKSITLSAGDSKADLIGQVRSTSQGLIFAEVYVYLQCKLPAQGRVFSVDTASSYHR